MLDGIQNIFLQLNVLHLLILQNHIFPDALHGVELLVKLVLHQEYFTESTLADQFSEFEVLQLWFRQISWEHIDSATSHGLPDL